MKLFGFSRSLKIGAMTIFIGMFVVIQGCQNRNEQPPNIILFLVDDMGLMDTSVPFLVDSDGEPTSYPLNKFYRTPNMESLSKKGIRFSNYYAHSVCSPTRASIMTGQNSARHRTTTWILSESNNRTAHGPPNWNWKGLTASTITLPKLLQEKGYRTIHIGKSHLGPFESDGEDPKQLGFDVNIAGSSIGQPGSYYGKEGYGHIGGQKARAVPGLEKYHNRDIFLTEALTLEANAEISKAHSEGLPFFLNLSHYAVHAPFHSDPRFASNYTSSGKSEKAQAYATLIEGIDKSLGDILNNVKELGIGENTLILFLGDNGSDAPLDIVDGYGSSAPLRGKKGNHWEGGMRVPFIASWVSHDSNNKWQKKLGIRANGIQKQIGSILDIFPTLTKLIEMQTPDDHISDGHDLSVQFLGQHNDIRENSFLNHFPHGEHRSDYFTSLIDGDWKIIYHYPITEEARYELYNLKVDPFESNNLSADEPLKLQELMERIKQELLSKKALFPEKDGVSMGLDMPG